MTDDLTRRFLRYRDYGDADALADVFDGTAPALYRIGFHLLGDAVEAEDLVQQTFVIAMEKARRFRDDAPLRPWLIGILARRAKSALRRQRRRPPADDRVAGSAQQGALDAETRRFVDDAISALDAPYREVVSSWLDGGKPPREIAKELGRAPSLVRGQLHRGLKLLRGRLPRGLALPAFATIAVEPRGLAAVKAEVLGQAIAMAAPIGGALWLGGWVMTTKKWLAIVGVLALLGAAHLLVKVPALDPESAADAATVSPEVALSADPVPPISFPPSRQEAEPAGPLPLELTPPPAPVGDDAISGRVVADIDGRPVPHARVAMRSLQNWPPRYEWETQTDVDGRFRLGGMDLRSSARLTVLAEGFALWRDHDSPQLDATAVSGALDLGEIRLIAGETVEGVVFEADGTRAAGAELYVIDDDPVKSGVFLPSAARAAGHADDEGRFRVEHVASYAQPKDVQIVATTDRGVGMTAVRITQGMAVARGTAVHIAPSAAIEVFVTDEDGEPIAGAEVAAEPRLDPLAYLTSQSDGHGRWLGPEPVHEMWFGPHESIRRLFRGETDARGRASLPRLPLPPSPTQQAAEVGSDPVGPFDLVVRREGYEPAFMDDRHYRPDEAVTHRVQLVREHLWTLSGRVVDQDGTAVAGSTLCLEEAPSGSPRDQGGAPVKRVNCAHTTDADGRFEIGGVPSGRRWALLAQKDGYSGERIQLDGDAASPIILRLVREPEHFTIAGRLVDQQGRPLPGIVLVVAEPVRGDGRPGDRTDVDGRFSIRTPFPGEQTLQGMDLLFPPGRFEDPGQTFAVRAGDEGLELVLNRIAGSCAVTLEVVDALDGTPLELASAWLFPADPGSPLRAERPMVSPGRVEVEAVPPGRWRLSCQVDGRGEVEHAFDVPDAASSLHERVEVPRLGTVRVRFEWAGASTDPVTLTFDRRVFVDDDRNVRYVNVAPNAPLLVRAQPGPLHLSIDGRFAYGKDAEVVAVSDEEREVVIRGGPGGQLTTAGLAAMTPASAALFLRTEDEQDWRCISVHRRRSSTGDSGYELTKGVAPGRGQWRVHRTEEDPAEAAGDDDPAMWPVVAEGAYSIAVGETVPLRVSPPDRSGR